MSLVRHELGLSKMESRFPTKATCLAIYSRAVNAERPLDDLLRGWFPWCAEWKRQLRELFAGYVEAKQTQNVLDFDDLLLYWAQTASDPVLAAEMGARFDHVLVDEYQDTNRLQATILHALKPDGVGLVVVGDDDLLALLRFVENPRDRVAGFRVMQLLPGVGPALAQRVLEAITDQPDPLHALANIPTPSRAGDTWPQFVETVREIGGANAGWPAEMACARRWYEPHLERMYEDAPTRHADLLQLEQIAAGYPSRLRFLTELSVDSPADATSDQAGPPVLDEDYLILSTIHSAKGQEWRSVFVLNVVDGCIPSDLSTRRR